ncbi:hypothetical protein NCTGTJJY_CDS0147 [Serratia phage 92A1]|nr:hypothetical protein NCTGTJJY_CDS0147 [Serratia phage 92A1]
MHWILTLKKVCIYGDVSSWKASKPFNKNWFK